MKLTSLDKTTAALLRASLEEAVRLVATKHSVSIRIGTIRLGCDHKSCQVSLEVATIAADGSVNSPEVEDFKRYAELYGFKPEFLNQTFSDGDHTYRVKGFNSGRRKYPIVLEDVRAGKRCFGSVAFVLRGFRNRMPPEESAVPDSNAGMPSVATEGS